MIKDPHFEIVGVVTQPDRPAGRKLEFQPSPVKALAKPLGIPVFTPESVNAPESLEVLRTLRAETAVVVAFGQILSQAFLDLFPDKVVNLHVSLLPKWRGAAPIQRALMNGDRETGVSLQVMVKKLDAGPILGARTIPLDDSIGAREVFELSAQLGVKLLEIELMDYLRGNLSPTPQDPAQATRAPKIDKKEAEIDWSWPATRIHNLVRGLNLGPVAQTVRDGKILKIHKTRAHKEHGSSLRPGQVLNVTDKSLIINCGEGSLELLEVQPESRAKMAIVDYLRGYAVRPGDVFGVLAP